MGFDYKYVESDEKINSIIEETIQKNGIKVVRGNIHCTDTFYNDGYEEYLSYGCLGVEMETFALFTNAKKLNKKASAILTVSDSLVTKEMISSDEREKNTLKMIELALDSIINL